MSNRFLECLSLLIRFKKLHLNTEYFFFIDKNRFSKNQNILFLRIGFSGELFSLVNNNCSIRKFKVIHFAMIIEELLKCMLLCHLNSL